ncbi:hypothetical protein EJ08DRAFT_703137 [Tothia fuscella]|uniref:Uncharacterized protein n=1 Tax=Tothia fuscella TaxID=1048955 RepID=A0A9P4TT32_9PEZI|nr:hypothetical protein EJ08DRAFT_703137 [Tothia fuscella]
MDQLTYASHDGIPIFDSGADDFTGAPTAVDGQYQLQNFEPYDAFDYPEFFTGDLTNDGSSLAGSTPFGHMAMGRGMDFGSAFHVQSGSESTLSNAALPELTAQEEPSYDFGTQYQHTFDLFHDNSTGPNFYNFDLNEPPQNFEDTILAPDLGALPDEGHVSSALGMHARPGLQGSSSAGGLAAGEEDDP